MSAQSPCLNFRKSSFSESGNCVEVATQDENGLVYIRDSKNQDGEVLSVSASSWREFTQRVRNSAI